MSNGLCFQFYSEILKVNNPLLVGTMDTFEQPLVVHYAPLVVVQGLGAEIAEFSLSEPIKLNNNLPLEEIGRQQDQVNVGDLPIIREITKTWKKYHVDEYLIWDNCATKSQIAAFPYRYRFKFVDNNYSIPIPTSDTESNSKSSSILSPFNPKSELFPDKIFTVDWLEKYKSILPAVFISCFELKEDLDSALIVEINDLKLLLSKRNIKLVVLIFAKSVNDNKFDERMNNIRKQTGLGNKSLYSIIIEEPNSSSVVAISQEIVHTIKPVIIEFYSNIEKKIRKKRVKVLSEASTTYTKNHIETRYALKLGIINEFRQQYDFAIKCYEAAYENLIEIFNNLQINDKNWGNFRKLLDFSLFHIIKLNLYLEQPNSSYKKFDVHLQSVIYFLKKKNILPKSFQVCNWLYVQFKWLAQLSDLAPSSAVPTDIPFFIDQENRLSPLVLPHSGYLYLQSAHLLKRREKYSRQSTNEKDSALETDTYLSEVINNTAFSDELLNLLLFAKLSFQKKRDLFEKNIAYINYQLGEQYLALENFEKSFKFFEQSIDIFKEGNNWNLINQNIYFRLIKTSIHMHKFYASTLNFIELSLIKDLRLSAIEAVNLFDPIKSIETDDTHNFPLSINLSSDESFNIFESEVLFRFQTITLTKVASLQVKLIPLFNNILNNSRLNELTISMEGSIYPIVVKHDGNLTSSMIDDFEIDENLNILICKANLSFENNECKILQFNLPTKKIGPTKCISINSVFNYKDIFNLNLNIPIKTKNLQNYYEWKNFEKNSIETIVSNKPTLVDIIPRIPDTKVNIENFKDFGISSEIFKIIIKITNTDEENIDLKLGSKVTYSNMTIVSSWDEVSNSELSLKSLPKDKVLLHELSFKVPNIIKNMKKSKNTINIELSTNYYVGDEKEVPITDSLNVSVPIKDPFDLSYLVSPRIREHDLQSIFQITEDEKTIPDPLRFWLLKVNVMNLLSSDIEILHDSIEFKPAKEIMSCNEISELYHYKNHNNNNNDKRFESNHFFETTIQGHSVRSIQFDSVLKIKWKRIDSDIIYEFINEAVKLTLPLLDPRVLLDIKINKDKNDLKLNFMIENPTTKIFNFSFNLIENNNFQITGTKSMNISILPFTRQVLSYHAIPLAFGWLSLPQFKVQDLTYKVSLPTLLVTSIAQTNNNEIYINIPE